MTLVRDRWTSCRHTPLWVLLLGMRHQREARVASEQDQVAGIEIEGVAHRNRHRWKRSLRAPMVLRVLNRVGIRLGGTDRTGQVV